MSDSKELALIRKRVSLNQNSDLAKKSSMWKQVMDDRQFLLSEVDRLTVALRATERERDGLSP